MLARELVSILEETNSDYSRQELLQEINYVQRIIFGAANMYTIVTDTTTGLDPKITPTTGEWTIDDALRIDRVYQVAFDAPAPVRIVSNTIYFNEQQIGQEFHIRYHTKPTAVISEATTLLVPDEYVDVLEDGVEERIQSKEHGSKEGWKAWKRYEMPKLQRKLNNNYRWGISDGTKKISSNYRRFRQPSYC